MSWSGLFKEAATAGKRELTVKRQSYTDQEAQSIETWSDETLFKVRGLNHLRLMGFTDMKTFSPLVRQLNSLLELILTNNGLESLPEEIGSLSKLRLLDASHNQLKLLPQSFYQLSSLQKLLLGHNQLTIDSFSCYDGTGMSPFPSIQYINMSHNGLTELPPFIYESASLLELLLPNNSIEILSCDVSNLTNLKTLELTHNSIHSLPSELSQCSKLRTIAFDDNPIDNKRLVKILNQFGETKPKAVLDYLASSTPSRGGGGKGKGKKKKSGGASLEPETDVVSSHNVRFVIKVVRPEKYVIVKSMNSARQVRPYLVCVIVRGLNLKEDGALRTFLILQTRIHETVCNRRRHATIATHCLSSLTPPLIYQSRVADKINLQPLDWDHVVTARRYLSHLRDNSADKPRDKATKPYSVDVAASHISKFLPLVDANHMVYLSDSTGTVISLPPLTNCNSSKITEESRDILIEVTSATSLAHAKTTMDALLVEMVTNELHSTDTDDGFEATPPTTTPPQLIVEQVKVIDETDKVIVMYPARIDLVMEESNKFIEIQRPIYR